MSPTAASPPLIIVAAGPAQQPAAAALARALNLPVHNAVPASDSAWLVVTTERLELRVAALGGAVCADFTSRLRLRGGWRAQPLARAVGIKPGFRPSVIDASAGLGGDAGLLACLGCRVLMLERSPVIGVLLGDAMDRSGVADAGLTERLSLKVTDSRDYLAALPPEQRPDVVYFDPMYPDFGRTARARKEMQVLRRIVGDDGDAPALLALALARARRRVVVKRPRLAPVLDGPAPARSLIGSSTRFDIYLREPLG